jgi:hypothetical protein
MMHEGKAYDFDFDFRASHRMVCTEVIYRAYEGVADVKFDLQRHVGRLALGANELVQMALERRHFEVVAVYSPAHMPTVQFADAAIDIIHRAQGVSLASAVRDNVNRRA